MCFVRNTKLLVVVRFNMLSAKVKTLRLIGTTMEWRQRLFHLLPLLLLGRLLFSIFLCVYTYRCCFVRKFEPLKRENKSFKRLTNPSSSWKNFNWNKKHILIVFAFFFLQLWVRFLLLFLPWFWIITNAKDKCSQIAFFKWQSKHQSKSNKPLN